jgi:hypothetical protein
MNRRRFVLHLLVGLLTFLIGVTAAIALGGFNPLDRLIRHRSSRQLTIPPQPLVSPCKAIDHDYHYHYVRPRTADLRYQDKSLTPPPTPIAPVAPSTLFEEESETLPPRTPSAKR